MGDGLLERIGIGLVGGPEDAFLQAWLVGFLALVLVELIQAFANGLYRQACAGVQVPALDRQFAEGEQGVGSAAILENGHGFLQQLAIVTIAQLRLLAAADQQYPLGADAGQGEQHQGLPRSAGDVATLDGSTELAAADAVEVGGGAGEGACFVDADDQATGFDGFRCAVFDVELHGAPQDKSCGLTDNAAHYDRHRADAGRTTADSHAVAAFWPIPESP